MNKNELLIGSHVSMNSPDFFLGSVKEALSYGSTCFMFYTGAPQNSFRKPLNELKIEEGRKLLQNSGIDVNNLVVHAPYIINGANKTRQDLIDLSIKLILSELKRTQAFGAKVLVLHPGAHVGQGSKVGIEALAQCLDEIFSKDGTDVKIALETMSGKGSEIGINFEEIKQIISLCHFPERLGVCVDTCHLNDAGYQLINFDNVLDEFDRIIGLDKLLVVHLNDSKNPIDSHKDRHENLGYGTIGFDTLCNIANNPRLKDIPKILETPFINNQAPYKKEIEMLKNKKFEENWKDQFN